MARRKIQAVLAQMQKNLECSICLEMMKNPVSTACGHQFCRFCIMEFLERKKQVPCPLCKKPVTKRGMKEREQLGEIVSNVNKLIEAYQTDTGALFSPPRGSSMNMLPSTPESIKTKPTKATTRRQSNVRGSNTVSAEKREGRRLQMENKQGSKQSPQPTASDSHGQGHVDGDDEDNGIESDQNTVDSANEDNSVGDVTREEGSNVQQLLDLIETGSHGAVENDSQSEVKLTKTLNLKSLTKQIDVSNTNSKEAGFGDTGKGVDSTPIVDDLEIDNSYSSRNGEVKLRHPLSHTEEENQNGPEQTKDLILSGMSARSQSSSEEVLSLFRTPLDVKNIDQNNTKNKTESESNSRSLRSRKNSHKQTDHTDTNNDEMLLTPDCNSEEELFGDKKTDIIKTYSKKNLIEKDVKSKRKVSDWLRGLPNGKSESTVVPEKKEIIATKPISKSTVRKQTVVAHKEEMMGQRIKTLAGLVDNDHGDSMFGFIDLDQTANDELIVNNEELRNDRSIEKHEDIVKSDTEKQENFANSDANKDATTENLPNMPVKRKRIFKSKQIASNTIENDDAKEMKYVECTDEVKSKVNAITNRNNIVENVEDPIQTSENPERLLKMSDSPMTGSPGGLDPYEFRSSQKTPQKLKKTTKSKKAKPKNTKKNVVKETRTNKTGIMTSSKVERQTAVEIPMKVDKSKSLIHKKPKTDVLSPELTAIIVNINEAEDHDLMTCTQEVLKNMPDCDTHQSKQGQTQKEGKKQVRFREPVLADFISPGKIDIAAYRKEKEKCHKAAKASKEKLCSANQSIPVISSMKGHVQDDCREHRVEKMSLSGSKVKKSLISEEIVKDKPLKDESKRQNPSSKEENGNDSDDMSEDYRFHDDSSGTDDLDINPDCCEFEQPDIDKQPEELKTKLSERKETQESSAFTDNRSPDVNMVTDTPQIMKGPRFKSGFAKPYNIPSLVPKVVNIVAETPLYVDQDSELEKEQTQTSLDNVKVGVHKEEVNEDPVKVSEENDGTVESTVEDDAPFCDDEELNTLPEELVEDTVDNNDISEDPVHASTANDGTEELIVKDDAPTFDNEEVKAIPEESVEDSAPLNFDIETLEETEDVIPNSTAGFDSQDVNDVDNDHDEMTCDTYVATKVTNNETNACLDTDETQTPSGDFNPEVENKAASCVDVNDKGSEDIKQNSCEIVQETMDSMVDSQGSISVLEINNPFRKDEEAMEAVRDNTYKTVDGEDYMSQVSVNTPQVKKKKRKCFMLEDTQDPIEICTSNDSSNEGTSKRQRTMSQTSHKDIEEGNMDNDSEPLIPDNVTTIASNRQTDKQDNHEINESQSEVVLISQISEDDQPCSKSVRHLSGMLMSPEENEEMSPENIFCIESEMPAVDFSPEEETQCKNSPVESNMEVIADSLTQKTHVSDTQASLTQEKIPSTSGSKRKSGVKASRGFSKRTRHSDEDKSSVDTPGTPQSINKSISTDKSPAQQIKGHSTGLCDLPKKKGNISDNDDVVDANGDDGGDDGDSVKLAGTPEMFNSVLTDHNQRLPSVPVTSIESIDTDLHLDKASPTVNKVLSTPRRHNILKYKSPVAGVKSLTRHKSPSVINTPSTPLSSAALRKIAKYSPGVHRVNTPSVHRAGSPGVHRVNSPVILKAGSPVSPGIHKAGALSQNPGNKQTPLNNAVEVVEVDCNDIKGVHESQTTSSNKSSVKKRSPILKLTMGSQERSKMLEKVESGQVTEIEDEVNNENRHEDLPLPYMEMREMSEVQGSGGESNMCDSGIKIQNNTSSSDKDYEVNDDGHENQINMESVARLHQIKTSAEDRGEDSSSSDDLCLDDSFLMERDSASNDKHTINKTTDNRTREANENTPNINTDNSGSKTNKNYNPYSFDLCLDDSDSEDDNDDIPKVVNVDKQTDKERDSESEIDASEAQVIEESDLEEEEEEVDEGIKKPEGDLDEIRNVKRLRPKRAILSESEDDSEDESANLDCTSSSAFSSQSDNLTTQDREKLESDLAKMRAEMDELKNQLKKGKTKGEDKDPVVILDDDDDERIEDDKSDEEVVHESCMSPPPFSPVILSQDGLYQNGLSQDSSQETLKPEKESMASTENGLVFSAVRKALQDIDVNIIRDSPDIVKDLPIEKKRLGFVATGLSSMQVMEIKKLAAANDVVFYSKMNASVTHVIVKADEDDNRMCDRTLKFFQGIAHKCWLVIYQWILDSKEAGYLLPEGHYEIQGDTTMGVLHNGPRNSRLSKDPLFKGVHFSLFGDNQYLNKDSLVDLIMACGGETVDFDNLQQDGKGTLVICCTDLEEEGSQEATEALTMSKELKREYGVVTLKRDWIMDSLTTYKLQPIKPYMIV